MDDQKMYNAMLVLALIRLLVEKGIPAYIEWKDGQKLEGDVTLERIEELGRLKRPEDF